MDRTLLASIVAIAFIILTVILFIARKKHPTLDIPAIISAVAAVVAVIVAIVAIPTSTPPPPTDIVPISTTAVPAAEELTDERVPQTPGTNTPTLTPTSTPTPSATPSPTPTPSPTDGRILFEDDFDTGTAPGRLEPGTWRGWDLREAGQATWEIRERAAGDHMLCVIGNDGYAVVPSAWQDYALELELQVVDFTDGGEGNIQVRDQEAAYELRIEREEISLWRQHGNFLARTTMNLTQGTWHTLRFEARGSHLEVFLDSASILEARDDFLKEGGIRLGARGGAEACFDNVQVTAMGE